MQKALAELEGLGLLNTHRSSGRTVSEDEEMIAEHKKQIASGYIENYFVGMAGIGFKKEEAIRLLTSYEDDKVKRAPASVAESAYKSDGAANPAIDTTTDPLEVE